MLFNIGWNKPTQTTYWWTGLRLNDTRFCGACAHGNLHGGLLSLNAWELSPTPRKIEMVTYTHSNEPDNRCPLNQLCTRYIKRNQHLKAILTVINTFELYCKQKSRGLVLPTVGSGSSNLSTYARRSPTTCVQKTTTTLGD